MPHVCNFELSPLPHLYEYSRPYSHNERVEAIVGCVGVDLFPLSDLISYYHALIDEKNESWDGWKYQPTRVEDLIGIEKSHLFSIVVGYKLQGLHIILVVASNEAEEKSHAMLSPRIVDLRPELIMQRVVLQNHP